MKQTGSLKHIIINYLNSFCASFDDGSRLCDGCRLALLHNHFGSGLNKLGTGFDQFRTSFDDGIDGFFSLGCDYLGFFYDFCSFTFSSRSERTDSSLQIKKIILDSIPNKVAILFILRAILTISMGTVLLQLTSD